MDEYDCFYLLEETIEAIRKIERNLELNLLDPESIDFYGQPQDF